MYLTKGSRAPGALVAVAGFAAAITLYLFLSGSPTIPQSFTVNDSTFKFTYVAVTLQQREAGLMNKTVNNSTFMLFIFPNKGINAFWMYNTYYNLDIIWLNSSSQNELSVADVRADAQPCHNESSCAIYVPHNMSDYVIEAKAGFAKNEGIMPGTRMTLNYR